MKADGIVLIIIPFQPVIPPNSFNKPAAARNAVSPLLTKNVSSPAPAENSSKRSVPIVAPIDPNTSARCVNTNHATITDNAKLAIVINCLTTPFEKARPAKKATIAAPPAVTQVPAETRPSASSAGLASAAATNKNMVRNHKIYGNSKNAIPNPSPPLSSSSSAPPRLRIPHSAFRIPISHLLSSAAKLTPHTSIQTRVPTGTISNNSTISRFLNRTHPWLAGRPIRFSPFVP